MPTRKPKVQGLINEKTSVKFKIIQEIEDRSESYLTGKAVEEFVKKYEIEHGEIIVGGGQN